MRMLAALLIFAAHSAAQTPALTTLHSFTGGADGIGPSANVAIGSGGTLYGTTGGGGNGGGGSCYNSCGTVYALTPPSSHEGAWIEIALHAFNYRPNDGGLPFGGVVIGSGGVLYGTTYEGRTNGVGVVFSVTPPSSPEGTWTETVLHNFDTFHGSYPYAGVVIGDGGVLFGATLNGDAANSGTVFALRPPTSPGGAWVHSVLHSFGSGSDGNFPSGSLLIGPGGVLYGTTAYGGAAGLGTVFALVPSPAGSSQPWHEAVLYDFKGGSDGAYPYAALVIGKDGAFYGTTEFGGTGPCTNTHLPSGCGTVFSLTPHGGGVWTEAVLHASADLPTANIRKI